MEKGVLTRKELKKVFGNAPCYIYGAGNDGLDCYYMNKDIVDIRGFIDKKKRASYVEFL